MRYWLYKTNRDGGPAGYWGDWQEQLFNTRGAKAWGGSRSTRSPEVHGHLNERVAGDVVVSYQADDKSVVGFCIITKMKGPVDDREMFLKPLHRIDGGLDLHQVKKGTILESSAAVNGRVMLRELTKPEVTELLRLAEAPRWILRGAPRT